MPLGKAIFRSIVLAHNDAPPQQSLGWICADHVGEIGGPGIGCSYFVWGLTQDALQCHQITFGQQGPIICSRTVNIPCVRRATSVQETCHWMHNASSAIVFRRNLTVHVFLLSYISALFSRWRFGNDAKLTKHGLCGACHREEEYEGYLQDMAWS